MKGERLSTPMGHDSQRVTYRTFYVPSRDHRGSYRVTDYSSVLDAEMEVMQRAID